VTYSYEEKTSDYDFETVLFFFISLTVLGLILFLIFTVFDSFGLTETNSMTIVGDKNYVPAHQEVRNILIGKAMLPTVINKQAAWTIDVYQNGKTTSCPVIQHQYDLVKKGESITARLTSGRFSGKTYCSGVVIN
jgi:hypothetical protein